VAFPAAGTGATSAAINSNAIPVHPGYGYPSRAMLKPATDPGRHLPALFPAVRAGMRPGVRICRDLFREFSGGTFYKETEMKFR